jgi:hypothetical protein
MCMVLVWIKVMKWSLVCITGGCEPWIMIQQIIKL